MPFLVGRSSITELYMSYKGSDGIKGSKNLDELCNELKSTGNTGKKSRTFLQVQKIRGLKIQIVNNVLMEPVK